VTACEFDASPRFTDPPPTRKEGGTSDTEALVGLRRTLATTTRDVQPGLARI
jgi:hypothetical protein